MSDNPHGPDWWKASDGKYYPPEQAPATPPPPPTPVAMAPQAPGAATGAANGLGLMFTVGVIGAAVIVVGALLPWASVGSVFGTMSMNGTEGDGVVTLIAGLVAAAVLVLGRRHRGAGVAAACVAMLVGAIALYDIVNVSSAIAEVEDDLAMRASVGAGLWATLIGAAVLGVGAIGRALGND